MTRRKRILIVEDSPVQALVLKQTLVEHRLDVQWAPDGRIGVALAKYQQPDLIIMDIQMPELNGLEACCRLKEAEETRDIPIVLLTGHIEADYVAAGLEAGAVDFIPKDAFSTQVLLETLYQLNILGPVVA